MNPFFIFAFLKFGYLAYGPLSRYLAVPEYGINLLHGMNFEIYAKSVEPLARGQAVYGYLDIRYLPGGS